MTMTMSRNIFRLILLCQAVTMTVAFLDYSNPSSHLQPKHPPKAALVFLHGLGNSPQTCIPLIQDGLLQLDPTLSRDLKFVFPSAPRLCSTINGGQCLPCWFDLYDWPVKVSVRDDREGIRQAVAQIQREITQLEAEGIPRHNIVVGGFSQGAALALETAYGSGTHHNGQQQSQPFAGCIALSGWLPLRDTLKCTPQACQTPLFWGHGQFDDSVKPEQQFFGVKKLLQQGVQSTTTKSYEMGHGVSTEELVDIAAFLQRVIHQQQPESGGADAETAETTSRQQEPTLVMETQ